MMQQIVRKQLAEVEKALVTASGQELLMLLERQSELQKRLEERSRNYKSAA